MQDLLNSLDKAHFNPSLSSLVSNYNGRPFVIYGAGSAGKCVCDTLLKVGVKPEFILDSHANNLPSHYLDIPIYLPNQHHVEDSWKKEAIVLVCVIQGTEIHDLVAKNLTEDGFVTIIPWIQKAFSPEIIKTSLVEPRLENFQEQILLCAELFKDNLSRETYLNIMTACLLRCFDNLNFSDPEEQYFPTDIEMRKGYQSFIDCGAFCGDTFNKLVEKRGTPQVYIAFEPDYRNFSILAKCVDCSVPWDYIPKRSYPLFQAREALRTLSDELRTTKRRLPTTPSAT
ncbi:hypothetical protein [Allochromatium warmingii]|nr:hypothetical protein [Allochromatium warmingii]